MSTRKANANAMLLHCYCNANATALSWLLHCCCTALSWLLHCTSMLFAHILRRVLVLAVRPDLPSSLVRGVLLAIVALLHLFPQCSISISFLSAAVTERASQHRRYTVLCHSCCTAWLLHCRLRQPSPSTIMAAALPSSRSRLCTLRISDSI